MLPDAEAFSDTNMRDSSNLNSSSLQTPAM